MTMLVQRTSMTILSSVCNDVPCAALSCALGARMKNCREQTMCRETTHVMNVQSDTLSSPASDLDRCVRISTTKRNNTSCSSCRNENTCCASTVVLCCYCSSAVAQLRCRVGRSSWLQSSLLGKLNALPHGSQPSLQCQNSGHM